MFGENKKKKNKYGYSEEAKKNYGDASKGFFNRGASDDEDEKKKKKEPALKRLRNLFK